MATWQHLRSSTANKRPTTSLADGRIAINTNTASPGLFFKDSAGTGIVKVGPVHVGTTAPNSTPAVGGSTGNYKGEQWLDTSVSPAQLKVWNGSAWVGVVADELPVSKLQDGDAGQIIQTDAAGTGVEWSSTANLPLGSAAAPAYRFQGDANSGVYSPGADQVAISTAGTGRLFVDSSGRLLAGTSSARSISGVDHLTQIEHVTGGSLSLVRNAPAAASGPIFSFAKSRGSAVGDVTSVANGDVLGRIYFAGADGTDLSNQAAEIKCEVDNVPGVGDMPGRLVFSTTSDGASSPTERLRITSAGLVGIGTSAPGTYLDTRGFTSYRGNAYTIASFSANNTLAPLNICQSEDGTNPAISAGQDSSGVYKPLVFMTSEQRRMSITSAGLVGIGTSSPAGILHLASAATTRFFIEGSDGRSEIRANNGNLSFFANGNADPAGTNATIFYRNGNNESMRITSAGLVGIGTSAPAAKLEVNGAVRLSGGEDFQLEWINNGQNWRFNNSTTGRLYIYDVTNTKFPFGVDANTPSDTLTLKSTGKVGIGTASPAGKLHTVLDTSYAPGGAWDSKTAVFGGSTSTSGAFGIAYDDTNGAYLTSIVPGSAWKPLTLRGSYLSFATDAGGERARIDNSGRLLLGTSAPLTTIINGLTYAGAREQLAGTDGNQTTKLISQFSSASTVSPTIAFARSASNTLGTQTAITTGGTPLGRLTAAGSDGTKFIEGARIDFLSEAAFTTDSAPTRLAFYTTPSGSATPVERMRITNAGAVLVGATSVVDVTSGTQDGFTVFSTGDTHISKNGTAGFWLRRRTSDGAVAAFYRDTTQVGTISVTTTATAYNTSSDYRLKENVTPVTDGITRLQQLKPSRFNFIADPDKTVDGFLAHEVQTIVPEAITGEKDAVDDKGNPEYQGIDQSKLVPLLTAALQEAIGEIESLKARLTAAGL